MNFTLLFRRFCRNSALLAAAFVGSIPLSAAGAATLVLLNGNLPGEGFNDPTPAVPVGGNPGTTLGEQRIHAFQHAAAIWGSRIHSPEPIEVYAAFEPLSCSSSSAVLGTTGTAAVWSDFPGATLPETWYGSALANRLAGFDLDPFYPDIFAFFNSDLGGSGCLDGVSWYLGLDGNHGAGMDLVTVFLHELAHGLGFQQFTDLTTGEQLLDQTDAYGRHLLDSSLGKTWDQLSNEERAYSAGNTRRLSWNGPEVTAAAAGILTPGTPFLRVHSPSSLTGDYAVGTATFGPALTPAGVTGELAFGIDAEEEEIDGCTPLLNAGEIGGRIAVVVRGGCDFTVKALHAQQAGAIGLVVIDLVPGSPPPELGGFEPAVTIPAVRVSFADGLTLATAMGSGPVQVTLSVERSVRLGADRQGRVLMNAPDPVLPGVSISHWDPIATPNQLMEPILDADLSHSVREPQDLTVALLRDLGWFPGWAYSKYDLNGSGCVDRTDLNLLNSAIRSRSRNPEYDLNLDGRVDAADARLLSLRYTNPGGVACASP
jgi:hypothetical protein